MTLDDFVGLWTMTRQIEDRRAGRQGTLSGQARFTPDKGGLLYSETGTLRFPGQPDLSARQSYLWQADGDAINVLFHDGRPFHRFVPKDVQCAATHDCPPDTYNVRYYFAQRPGWSVTWFVTGPRKNYEMHTGYVRIRV